MRHVIRFLVIGSSLLFSLAPVQAQDSDEVKEAKLVEYIDALQLLGGSDTYYYLLLPRCRSSFSENFFRIREEVLSDVAEAKEAIADYDFDKELLQKLADVSTRRGQLISLARSFVLEPDCAEAISVIVKEDEVRTWSALAETLFEERVQLIDQIMGDAE